MLDDLLLEASALLDRPVEVQKLRSGKFSVLYFSFGAPPPPVAATAEEALEKFIEWYKAMPVRELEDIDENVLKELKGEPLPG